MSTIKPITLLIATAACFGFLTLPAHAQDGLRSPVLPEIMPNTPPPQVPPADIFQVGPGFYRQPPSRVPFPIGVGGWPIYGAGGQPVVIVVGQNGESAGQQSASGDGFLRLDVTPATTEVIIDGVPSGRASDFDTRMGRPVRAGVRRIELRAPGGRTTSVELRVTSGDTISYSGRLDADAPLPLPVRAPKKTFYVIDRCYAGDSAPDPEKLSLNCRAQKVKTFER